MKSKIKKCMEKILNYGIMEKKVETKVCKGTGEELPLSEFYYDNRNKRYESYSKGYKTMLVKQRRKVDDSYQLRQEVYNLRHRLKQAQEEIKNLKAND